MTREEWLDRAEVIDSLRVFPRILTGGYMLLVGFEIVYLTIWYAHLPSADRTVEVTAFYGMLTGGLFGLAAYVFTVYSDGGRDWDRYRGVKDAGVSQTNPG